MQWIILGTIVNGLWYARNDDLGKDLRVRTDEEEIERFANKYKARLENHPNSPARSLYTLPRRLQKAHPDDLTTTQYLNIAGNRARYCPMWHSIYSLIDQNDTAIYRMFE